jgi:hypothetical protein
MGESLFEWTKDAEKSISKLVREEKVNKGLDDSRKKKASRSDLMEDVLTYLSDKGEALADSFIAPMRKDIVYVNGRENWKSTVEDVNIVYSKKFENIGSILLSVANVKRCMKAIGDKLTNLGLSPELQRGDRLGMVLFTAGYPILVLKRDGKTYLIAPSGLKFPENRDFSRVPDKNSMSYKVSGFLKKLKTKELGIAEELDRAGPLLTESVRKVVGNNVNFRSSPEGIPGSESWGQLNDGDFVDVVRDEGDWLLIRRPDQKKGLAYISAGYVCELEEVSLPKVKSHPYWDGNPDFFKKKFKLKKQNLRVKVEGKREKVRLIRDAGVTFYVVEKGDTLDLIWKKVSALDEFAYLKESRYRVEGGDGRNIQGFNITRGEVKKYSKGDSPFFIPIPLKLQQREVSDKKILNYFSQAIEEMKDHPVYGEKVRKLLKKIDKKELLKIMLAYAYSETTPLKGEAPVGFFGFNRWEPATTMNRKKEKVFRTASFSFTCFHVFMEKYHRTDKKTKKTRIENSPGLKARFVLGMTEGQINHPVNAGKLFFGYWFEKAGKSFLNYFPLEGGSDAHFKKCAGKYNGDGAKYYPKLKKNYERASKVVDDLMK